MVDCVLRFSNENAMRGRLASIGISLDEIDTETPFYVDVVSGETYFTIRLMGNAADKFPPNNNPAFSLVYRADEDEVWPTYTANTYDIDGNITGTYQQEVGKIA